MCCLRLISPPYAHHPHYDRSMTGLVALGVGVAAGLGLAFVLFLVANQVLRLVFRKKYKVYEKGAVVLTGASTGIGHHAARHLAARGFTVYATVRKQKDVDALNSLGLPTLVPVIMDVAKPVGGSYRFMIDGVCCVGPLHACM